jgi:hypothetical protein
VVAPRKCFKGARPDEVINPLLTTQRTPALDEPEIEALRQPFRRKRAHLGYLLPNVRNHLRTKDTHAWRDHPEVHEGLAVFLLIDVV